MDSVFRVCVGLRHHLPGHVPHLRNFVGSVAWRRYDFASTAPEFDFLALRHLRIPVPGDPLVFPSTWMTPLVWMGFAFFLDPINGRLGERSILSEFFTGERRSMALFFLAGLVAGVI